MGQIIGTCRMPMIIFPAGPLDVPSFCLISISYWQTMSPKSSSPNHRRSVSLVLTPDIQSRLTSDNA